MSDKRVLNNVIGGERVPSMSGQTQDLVNPSTGEVFASAPVSGPEDIDRAYAVAATAFEEWRDSTPSERQKALLAIADLFEEHAEELARTMTAEGGKPLIENRDELEWTAAAFDYYAEIGRDHAGRVIPPIESTQLAMVTQSRPAIGKPESWEFIRGGTDDLSDTEAMREE